MSLDYSNSALRQTVAALEGRREQLNAQIDECASRNRTLHIEKDRVNDHIDSVREAIQILASVGKEKHMGTAPAVADRPAPSTMKAGK